MLFKKITIVQKNEIFAKSKSIIPQTETDAIEAICWAERKSKCDLETIEGFLLGFMQDLANDKIVSIEDLYDFKNLVFSIKYPKEYEILHINKCKYESSKDTNSYVLC